MYWKKLGLDLLMIEAMGRLPCRLQLAKALLDCEESEDDDEEMEGSEVEGSEVGSLDDDQEMDSNCMESLAD